MSGSIIMKNKDLERIKVIQRLAIFCNESSLWDRNPVCNIEKIEIVSLAPDRLQITLLGDYFVLVRNLVCTLTYAGCDKLKSDEITAILKGKDRTRTGMTAPSLTA